MIGVKFSGAGNDLPALSRTDLLALFFLALAGLGIRLYFLNFYQVIASDGISYISIAKDFVSGRGLSAATHYPPLYPMLIGCFSLLFRDFETAGLAVSVVMGSLLVLPVYLLGCEFFDRKVAFAAAALAVTWPTLRHWSTAVMSQATYITLLLLGVYLLWRAYRHDLWLTALLAGVFFGCADLTRSEGVLVLFAEAGLLAVFSLNRQRRSKLLYLLLAVGAFFLVVSPYLVMLHELTGKWQLTGKSKVAIADALAIYLGKYDLKHAADFTEIGYLDLFRQYPDYIRTNYLKNVKACWNEMLPVYGWMLATIGLVAGSFGKEKALERAYLLASFAPLLVIIVFFFIGPEYTQPYLPVLFLLIGHGVFELWNSLLQLTGVDAQAGYGRFLRWLPLLPVVCYGAWNVAANIPADRNAPYVYSKDEGRLDEKHVGLKLRKLLPHDAVIMTRSGRIGFYSELRHVAPPQGSYSEMVDYARKNHVDYLIATLQVLRMRPQLSFLFGPLFDAGMHFVLPPELDYYLDPGMQFSVPPEVELVAAGQEPGGLPYLVYRFKR